MLMRIIRKKLMESKYVRMEDYLEALNVVQELQRQLAVSAERLRVAQSLLRLERKRSRFLLSEKD